MSKIIKSKKQTDGTVLIQLKITKEELKKLKSNHKGVLLVSKNAAKEESKILLKGDRKRSYYFDIPKNLKKDLINFDNAKCIRADDKEEILYYYLVDKITL